MIDFCIYHDVSGPAYLSLIEYALARSDAFMLVFFSYGQNGRLGQTSRVIHDGLRSIKIKTRYDPEWPGTKSLDDRNRYKIAFYKAEPVALSILKSIPSLFQWEYPNPSDICFFKGGRCWFVTTAHEKEAHIYLDGEKDVSEILNMGVKPDHVSDCGSKELFFESYRLR